MHNAQRLTHNNRCRGWAADVLASGGKARLQPDGRGGIDADLRRVCGRASGRSLLGTVCRQMRPTPWLLLPGAHGHCCGTGKVNRCVPLPLPFCPPPQLPQFSPAPSPPLPSNRLVPPPPRVRALAVRSEPARGCMRISLPPIQLRFYAIAFFLLRMSHPCLLSARSPNLFPFPLPFPSSLFPLFPSFPPFPLLSLLFLFFLQSSSQSTPTLPPLFSSSFFFSFFFLFFFPASQCLFTRLLCPDCPSIRGWHWHWWHGRSL